MTTESSSGRSIMRGLWVIGTIHSVPSSIHDHPARLALIVEEESHIKAALRYANSSLSEDRVEEAYKDMLERQRDRVVKILDGILKQEQQQRAQEARSNFRSISDVSKYGTVKEIADKLGVSKSEVRRMKQDGTLWHAMRGEEAIKELQN